MNGTTSGRSKSATLRIPFGFPARTGYALPRLRANATGAPVSPSVCSRLTTSLRPITTFGRTRSVRLPRFSSPVLSIVRYTLEGVVV